MAEYATGKTTGMAIGGLATGIIGTLGALHNGNGLNLLGGGGSANDVASIVAAVTSAANLAGNRCSDDQPITRYEMKMMQELAAKDSEIALLKSEQNTEIKIADVYERIMTRVNADRKEQSDWNAQQMVNNTTMSAAIAANATSISALQNCCNQITKLVVPNTAICPGWGNVTITPA